MKYAKCRIAAYLICHALLLTSSAWAEQTKESYVMIAGHAVRSSPHCTEKDPAPNCVSVPQVVSSPSPTYSDEGRKAKIEGSVVLILIVDEKGNPTNIRVINSLGMGLDEKAIEAVMGWKFEPAFGQDGKPIAKKIAVEVTFHL
jgi:TonB family protein